MLQPILWLPVSRYSGSEDFLRLTDDGAAGTVLKTQTQSYKGANPKVDMDAILAALPGLGAS